MMEQRFFIRLMLMIQHHTQIQFLMARKSALEKIESHEKLCRIMQKQTFEQIKEMQERIKRLEYWIVGGMGAVLLTLLMDMLN